MGRSGKEWEPLFPEVGKPREGLPYGASALSVARPKMSQETGGSRKIVNSVAEVVNIVRCAHRAFSR